MSYRTLPPTAPLRIRKNDQRGPTTKVMDEWSKAPERATHKRDDSCVSYASGVGYGDALMYNLVNFTPERAARNVNRHLEKLNLRQHKETHSRDADEESDAASDATVRPKRAPPASSQPRTSSSSRRVTFARAAPPSSMTPTTALPTAPRTPPQERRVSNASSHSTVSIIVASYATHPTLPPHPKKSTTTQPYTPKRLQRQSALWTQSSSVSTQALCPEQRSPLETAYLAWDNGRTLYPVCPLEDPSLLAMNDAWMRAARSECLR